MRAQITPWNSRRLTSDVWSEMDRFFDSFYSPAEASYAERSFAPVAEISESDESFALSLDLPGMKKEDIKIEVANNTLTISGERKREERTENQKVQRYEKVYGSFSRSFALPNTVQADKIEAHYENGVLEMILPKTSMAQSRKIEVQTGQGGILNKFLNSKKTSSGDQ